MPDLQRSSAISVIAHRGMGQGHIDALGPPENTLPAFEAGWRSGATACELDAQLSQDGDVVVIHDGTTTRTTNADWRIADRRAEELVTLDAGRWKGARWAGTRLPLLSHVLSIMPPAAQLFIELKDGPRVITPTADIIHASGRSPDEITFISFDVDTIAAAKCELPAFECLLLLEFQANYALGYWSAHFNEGPDFRPTSTSADFANLDKLVRRHNLDGIDVSFAMPRYLVQRFLRDGRRVVAWTVNDAEIALELATVGVTGITTDRPVQIRAALLAAGFQCA